MFRLRVRVTELVLLTKDETLLLLLGMGRLRHDEKNEKEGTQDGKK